MKKTMRNRFVVLVAISVIVAALSSSPKGSAVSLSDALAVAVSNEISMELHVTLSPLEVRQFKKADNWIFGMAVESPKEHNEGGEASYLFLAKLTGASWEVAIQYTERFRAWVHETPANLMPEGSRQIYGFNEPDANGDAQLSFPWATGNAYRLTQGPHSNNTGGPWSSLDFAGRTPDTNVPVLAARDGIAYQIASCFVRIDHADQWQTGYYHLVNVTVPPEGTYVQRGDLVGDTSCEICPGGSCRGPHVHWSLRKGGVFQDLEGVCIGGWQIHDGTTEGAGCLTKGDMTLCPVSLAYNEGSIGCGGSPTPTPTVTPSPPPFMERFDHPPDYTNKWHRPDASNYGDTAIVYTLGDLRLYASRSYPYPPGSKALFSSNRVFKGDIDVTFEYNHQGYGRTNVGLISADDTTFLALAALDTDDTNYLNFIVPPYSTEYEHEGTPYMNRWTTIRIKVEGLQVKFYAGVGGRPPTLLNTLPLDSQPGSFRLFFDVGAVPWKSGDNITSFRLVTARQH